MEHFTALVLWHERESIRGSSGSRFPVHYSGLGSDWVFVATSSVWCPQSCHRLPGLSFSSHNIASTRHGETTIPYSLGSGQNVDMTRQYVLSMPLMCSSNPGGDPSAAHCRPLLHINMWNAHSVSVREISTHSNRCFNNQHNNIFWYLFFFLSSPKIHFQRNTEETNHCNILFPQIHFSH